MSTFDKEGFHALIKQEKSWYRIPSMVNLYLLMLAPMVTSTSWGFDLSMTDSLQSVSTFMNRFGNPTGSSLGFYGAASSLGGVVACFVGGYLTNTLGRRACCFVGSVIVVAMGIMETFATSFGMFTAAKCLLGFGANVMQLGGPPLVMELAHPKSRVAISSLYNTNLYVGLVVGAWITYGTFRLNSEWSWKIPCILQIALPTYQLCMIWFCPESPRWLASKGRIEEARRILIKYHGNGQYTDLVKMEMQEIIANLEIDKTELKFNMGGIKTILGSKGNLHRLWLSFLTAVGSQCLGSTLVSAYLPDVLKQVGFSSDTDQTLINALVQLSSYICALIGAAVMPYVPRRKMFLWDTSAMLVIFIIWTALAAKYVETRLSHYGIGVVVMIFLFNMTYCVCWVPLVIVYPLETVTNKQRSVFFAFMYFCINGSAFVIQYVNPVGLANISWKYYIIQCVFMLFFILLMYFTFVETHGYTLEEISTIFDGDEDFNAVAVAAGDETEKVPMEEAAHTERVDNA